MILWKSILVVGVSAVTLSACGNNSTKARSEDQFEAPDLLPPSTGKDEFALVADDRSEFVLDADKGIFTITAYDAAGQPPDVITGNYDPRTGKLTDPANPSFSVTLSDLFTIPPLANEDHLVIVGFKDVISGQVEATGIAMPLNMQKLAGDPSLNSTVTYVGPVIYETSGTQGLQTTTGTTEVDFSVNKANTQFVYFTGDTLYIDDWVLGETIDQTNQAGSVNLSAMPGTVGWINGDVYSTDGTLANAELGLNFNVDIYGEEITGTHIGK